MKRCHKFGLLCRTNWIHIRHGHPSMIFLIKLMDTWASLSAHYLNILSNFESNATRVINQMWWNNPVTTGAQKYAPTNPPKKRQSHLQFLSFSPFFFRNLPFFCPKSGRTVGEQNGSARSLRSLLPGTRSTAVVTTEPCQLVFCFAWRNMHWWIDIIYIYLSLSLSIFLSIYLSLSLFHGWWRSWIPDFLRTDASMVEVVPWSGSHWSGSRHSAPPWKSSNLGKCWGNHGNP